MELNLKDFTREGLEYIENHESNPDVKHPYEINDEKYYEYKLTGVTVHVGTAEYGHYYSYIDTKRS